MAIDERDYFYEPRRFRGNPSSAVRTGAYSWRWAVPFWLAVLGFGAWAFSTGNWFRKPLPLPPSAPIVINVQPGAIVSPLTIRTSSGADQRHHYIKLEDWTTATPVAVIFVRTGESVTTKIAPGTFRLRVASGQSWYGPEALFGSDTVLTTGKIALAFTPTQGHVIDLSPVASGNLPMDRGDRF